MARYRIEYERDACIGAAVCEALDPIHFKIVDDGKADMLEAKQEGNLWILETDSLEMAVEAAQGCPVKIIKVIDTETGKRLDE